MNTLSTHFDGVCCITKILFLTNTSYIVVLVKIEVS